MPLVLAIKNRDALVVASDTSAIEDLHSQFGQLIALPNRSAILIAGNLSAVRHAIADIVMPKVHSGLSAAAVAQLVQAALVLDVVPKLPELRGRVEVIVAGIDPIRHVEEPGLYYLDSAQDFALKIVPGDAVAAGSTAAVTSLLAGHSFADSGLDHLQLLAKECIASTKLRWPAALGNHLKLGVITTQNMRFQQF